MVRRRRARVLQGVTAHAPYDGARGDARAAHGAAPALAVGREVRHLAEREAGQDQKRPGGRILLES